MGSIKYSVIVLDAANALKNMSVVAKSISIHRLIHLIAYKQIADSVADTARIMFDFESGSEKHELVIKLWDREFSMSLHEGVQFAKELTREWLSASNSEYAIFVLRSNSFSEEKVFEMITGDNYQKSLKLVEQNHG